MPQTEIVSRLAELKELVEQDLQRVLEQTQWPRRLQDAVQYSLMAGGKRLRPMLTLLGAEVCGGDVDAALPSASAVEMIHTYSLIHDDLPAMDDDDFRRGRPTSHRVFGEALAILAGDSLLTLAFETASSSNCPAEIVAEQIRLLAAAAGGKGMVGGQVLDLEAEQRLTEGGRRNEHDSEGSAGFEFNEDAGDPVERLIDIHSRKTGALITVALELGAVSAGASTTERQRLTEFGRAAGLAFQIADDLLDVAGNDERLGKQTGRDRDLGKLTYPGLIGIEESRRRADELVERACAAIEPFGENRTWLVELARFIVERDH